MLRLLFLSSCYLLSLTHHAHAEEKTTKTVSRSMSQARQIKHCKNLGKGQIKITFLRRASMVQSVQTDKVALNFTPNTFSLVRSVFLRQIQKIEHMEYQIFMFENLIQICFGWFFSDLFFFIRFFRIENCLHNGQESNGS